MYLIQKSIDLLSEYFELIITLQIIFVAFFGITFIGVWLSGISIRRIFPMVVRGSLLGFLIISQIFIAGLLGYIYWFNYHHPRQELTYVDEIQGQPYWIKDDMTIFFTHADTFASVNINGEQYTSIYTAPGIIKSYHLSPDGQHAVIATFQELVLVRLSDQSFTIVEEIDKTSGDIKGVLMGVRWAKDSGQFIYSKSLRSPYGQKVSHIVYRPADESKQTVRGLVAKNAPFYWDTDSAHIFYFRFTSDGIAPDGFAYDCLTSRIPLKTMASEFFAKFPTQTTDIPFDEMRWRDVELFAGADQLSFGRRSFYGVWPNEKGQYIGIDEEDYLYLVKKKWFKKRLFKVTRQIEEGDAKSPSYKEGSLTLENIRWLPGGRYVIMEDKTMGGVILDTANGRMGQLAGFKAKNFGWMTPP